MRLCAEQPFWACKVPAMSWGASQHPAVLIQGCLGPVLRVVLVH